MGIAEDKFLMPSAKDLSSALQTPAFCIGEVDDSTLEVGNVSADKVLEKATESDTVRSASANDYIEDTGEGTVKPAADVEVFDEGRTKETLQRDNFADGNKINNGESAADKNTNSEIAEQETGSFNKKPHLPEVGKARECAEKKQLAENLNQAENTSGEALLPREKKEEILDIRLERTTMRNERTSSQQMISHAEIIPHSRVTEPVKVTNENVDHQPNSCENTPSAFTAVHAGRETVEIPDTERPYGSKTSGGLSHEVNSLVRSQETAREFNCSEDRILSEDCLNWKLHIADSGDENRTIHRSLYMDLAADSSSLPLICTIEDRCLSPEASAVSQELHGSLTLNSVQRYVDDSASSGFDKGVDVSHDTQEHPAVSRSQVSKTVTNNSCSSVVCPKPTDSVLDLTTNGSDSQSNHKTAAVSIDLQCSGVEGNFREAVYEEFTVSGHSSSSCQTGKEYQRFCTLNSKKQNVELRSSPKEKLRKVKELTDDLQLDQTRAENQFNGLKETYSDPKQLDKLENTTAETYEDLDTTRYKMVGTTNSTGIAIEVKNEPGTLNSLQRGSNSKLEKLAVEENEEKPACSGMETNRQIKGEIDNRTLNTACETTQCRAGEDQKEEGEISSERGGNTLRQETEDGEISSEGDDNTLADGRTQREEKEEGEISSEGDDNTLADGKTRREEKEEGEISSEGDDNTLADGKTQRAEKEEGEISSEGDDNTLADGKTQREEKEEGELPSSDSDAETLVNSSLVQHAPAAFPVFQGKSILKREDGEGLASRPHPSSDSHRRKITKEEQNGKRRTSPFLQTNDLRTKLCEIHQKKISRKSKTARSKETKTYGPVSEPQSIERAMDTNATEKKHSNKLRNEKEHVQRHVKGHIKRSGVKQRLTKLQQSSQVKRCKAQRHSCESERKNTSNDSQHGKERNTSHSLRSTTRKPVEACLGQDKKTYDKSSQRRGIEYLPRRVKKGMNKPTAIQETDSKKVPKQSHAKTQQECKSNISKAKPVTKQTKKTAKDSHAATRLKGKTSSRSKAEKSSPAARNKLRGKTPAEHASKKSVTPQSKATSGSVLTHPLTKHNEVNKQCSVAVPTAHGKEPCKSRRPSGVKDAKSNGERKTTQSKTANQISARIATRKILKKSAAGVATRAKTKLQCGNETRQENPRKRRRSVDSTDARQAKKFRLQEKSDSTSKFLTISSKTELCKMSKKSRQYNSSREDIPPSCEMGKTENRMVPVRHEQIIESTAGYKCMDGSMKKSSEIASIQAKPILIGRNKCLVLKRRHVNQLFIRGDNVVMVAYAK